jgi:hypothetical protein
LVAAPLPWIGINSLWRIYGVIVLNNVQIVKELLA